MPNTFLEIGVEMREFEISNVPIHLLSNVPNDDGGKKVINDVRKYLNKNRYKIRVRGRGTRKEHGDQSYIPLQYAERFSIYVDQNINDYNNPSYYYGRVWKLEEENRELKRKLSAITKIIERSEDE